MNIVLVATFCQLFTATCEPVTVAQSKFDDTLNLTACAIAEPKITDWMKETKYASWRLVRWGCVIGEPARPI